MVSIESRLSKGRIFRNYIEEHYPFGEFALIRVRGDRAEVGFVLADEDPNGWPSLFDQAWRMANHLKGRLVEEKLAEFTIAGVGKDLDFITVSVIVDLTSFSSQDIPQVANTIMSLLKEINPYGDKI
ncbi:MAG: hypothetical protein PWP04_1726 [Candidatus Atribacteria bacterium]|nr:hypothetical protein [Candidatus Atribacteria bacterium]